ncbi:hypothetical protein [Labrys sp. ZIDIC5]|uniref:hypothetical protein n=1 Tax=Labrys sedimenti TaxID=3106036 RepID=UPI002ACA3E57|nr:hypothetical protein [Labrys sp. ZIDIC5]MDZ5448888.1 hypothetical protein [Labrys sp. ZIDIC5]
MTDRPILMSAPMVGALLAGTKTQTRRIIKPRHNPNRPNLFDGTWSDSYVLDPGNQKWRDDAYSWRVGDCLWVREALAADHNDQGMRWISYAADHAVPPDLGNMVWSWRRPTLPSIHMPRWASRLTLTVTGVKVERLRDISEVDAWDEGIISFHRSAERLDWPGASDGDVAAAIIETYGSARDAFRDLWEYINGPGSWEANPWVVALTFAVHTQNIDALKEAV